MDLLPTVDEQFWITPQPYLDLQPRDGQGRGTEAQTTARRLKTLELYANLSSARAITKFITDLGYSVTTAKEDLAWAKTQWLDMSDTEETVHVTCKLIYPLGKAEGAGRTRGSADFE